LITSYLLAGEGKRGAVEAIGALWAEALNIAWEGRDLKKQVNENILNTPQVSKTKLSQVI